MLTTPTIREMQSAKPGLNAFRITGHVTRDDMAAMGQRMVEAFDESDGKVDMLLIFDGFQGAEPMAGLSWPAIKARTASLWNVARYVTAGAPDGASAMIEVMGSVLPTETHAFDTEAEAWGFFDMSGPAG
ncbi:MAG: STAS/SEC14 domain-containing protein [Pseudomonadota bacterium]